MPEVNVNLENLKEKRLFGLCRSRQTPFVMGIVNVTPDSFFDGGQYIQTDAAIVHGIKLAEEGADVLDVGGESTRPGAEAVPIEEELRRVIPVIAGLKKETGIPISVDTQKSIVAKAALDAGAEIVNDISFGSFDDGMFSTVASKRAWYVGMHMQGNPEDMQNNPNYGDVVDEVKRFLRERTNLAIKSGVEVDKIVLDPGIGFGKNDKHNLLLLQNLGELVALGFPVLIGASRKSMMGRLLGLDPTERLAPSLAVALFAAWKGADVVRVHDVFETRQALRMWGLLSE